MFKLSVSIKEFEIRCIISLSNVRLKSIICLDPELSTISARRRKMSYYHHILKGGSPKTFDKQAQDSLGNSDAL